MQHATGDEKFRKREHISQPRKVRGGSNLPIELCHDPDDLVIDANRSANPGLLPLSKFLNACRELHDFPLEKEARQQHSFYMSSGARKPNAREGSRRGPREYSCSFSTLLALHCTAVGLRDGMGHEK